MMKNLIDRDRFRKAIRLLTDDEIYSMLSDAIEMLPPTKLERLAKGYLDLTQN